MAEFENLKLDHQLCFALYAATHALTRAYREVLEPSGLTYTQYLVMLVLWEHDNIPVGDVARRLDLDSATLTPILKRLEAAGLLNRTRKSDDQRVVTITLTSSARELQREVASLQLKVACQTGLDDAEFLALRETLHRLVERMNRQGKDKLVA